MPPLIAKTGAAIEDVRINALTLRQRDGRDYWVKRRLIAGCAVMLAANGFFRLARNPIRVLSATDEWLRWEIECFQNLHGSEFGVFAERRALWVESLPGKSLSLHLSDCTLTAPMLAAAGCELRRAHGIESAEYGGAWSHGDPHLGNFIHDGARARLIDFEVKHRAGLPADERHAADLLVLLQDLCGRCDGAQWLPLARAFLDGYGSPRTVALLKKHLVVPGVGFPRLWWAVRTTWMRTPELCRRIAALREAL